MNLQGATVLVTGGTGFLGRYVTAQLQDAGAKAIPVGSSDYDLRDRRQIDDMLTDIAPAAVIHLAAVVGGIGANRAEPGRFFYENARMGIELIDACRTMDIKKVVLSGTVCAYPKTLTVPFREADLWNGYPEETNAPYGLAKKMLLVQAQAYRDEYGMNSIYLIPVNLYGPGDNLNLETSHVIPAMIRKFVDARRSDAQEVVLWGDGSPTREFLYVEDAARAFRLALEAYDGAEPVNLGSGEEVTISELARLIAEATGYSGIITWDNSKPNGQPRRWLAIDRARALFNFQPTTSLQVGIARTVSWYESVVGA